MKRKITSLMMLMLFMAGSIAFGQTASDEDNPNFHYLDSWNFFPNPDYDPDDPESPELITLGVSQWWDPEGSGSTAGIILEDDEGNLLTYREHETEIVNPHTGSSGSMKLEILWDNDIEYEGTPTHLVRQHMPAGIADTPEKRFQPGQALEVFIYGDGSGNRFRFMTRDGIPTLEGSQWMSIDWNGWKRVTWNYNDPDNVVGWVNGDGQMDGEDFYFDSFQITKDEAGTATGGLLYFDDFRAVDPFNVVFNIDGADGSEVVSIENVTFEAGETDFMFFPGEYQYFVEKDGFVTYAGIFEVDNEDLTLDIDLQEGDDPEFTVEFNVLDVEGNSIDDAIVTIEGESGAAGEYTFDLTAGFYNYVVSKNLFFDTEGTFTVLDGNVFVNVELVEIPDIYDHIYLSWDVTSTASQSADRDEHYSVWVAQPESADAPFNDEDYVMIYEETLSTDNNNWQYQHRELEISEFQQQHIRIAFRHHNVTDKGGLVIDNVKVEGVESSLEEPDVLWSEDFEGGVPEGFDPDEGEPDYDEEWLPEGWMAIDDNEDDNNWHFGIRIDQDLTYKAFMRSFSRTPEGTALSPDNWLIAPYFEMPWVFYHAIVFEITDGEGDPIEDAIVTFDGETYEPGDYIFSVTNGTYDYAIEREGFFPVDGTIVVEGEGVTEEIVLEAIGIYEVTFIVNMLPYGGFEPGDDAYAYMTGNFPGWDNQQPGSFEGSQMEKTNNAFIFTNTLHIPAGTYNYLYFDGPSFDNAEWEGNEWREVVVEGPMDVEDVFAQTTSIPQAEVEPARVFPNPAQSHVNISSAERIQTVSIINIAGQQIYSNLVDAENYSIDLSDFNNGIYMVRVLTLSGMETYKLQVVK